jgi:hypothetical protein
MSSPLFFAFFASSVECRFSVGRSGSSAGTDPVEPLEDAVPPVVLSVLSEDLRFIVGRSGSSAGALVVDVVDDVVDPDVEVVLSVVPVEPAELSDRRFIVGRSGSSAGVLPVDCPVPCVDAVLVVVLPDDAVVPVPVLEDALSSEPPEDRRFIVGRSGSFDESLAAPVPAPAFAVDFVAPVELSNTGSVFEGFSFPTFFGVASGFTLPYPNQPSS